MGATFLILSTSILAYQHLVAATFELGDQIPEEELLAICFTQVVLRSWDEREFTMNELPTLECITLATRVSIMLGTLRGVWKIAQPETYVPQPSELFHGQLFWIFFSTRKSLVPVSNRMREVTNLLQCGEEEAKIICDSAEFMFRQIVLPFGGKLPHQPSGWTNWREDLMETPSQSTLENETQSAKLSHSLPIDAHRHTICTTVDECLITVIQGETGCGKSSRVPHFLLEAHRRSFIIVAQPHRVAAISLATRVASERKEAVGKSVGYRIGNSSLDCSNSNVVFVTNGWLFQKLAHNPNFFKRCTHVILDEIHDRSLDSDLVYLIMKELLLLHGQKV